MNLHGNAALSWGGRRELARRVVDHGWTVRSAAEAAGVSVRCARKWVGRYRDGDRLLLDRSSAPRRVANRTCPERVAVIIKLRGLRMTAAEIAETLAMPLSTVSAILTRSGLGRDSAGLGSSSRCATSARDLASSSTSTSRSSAESIAPAIALPATAATVATKARRAGSTSTSLSTTTAASPTRRCSPTNERQRAGFLGRALAFYRRHGVVVERVLTDNGSCYRGVVHALACRQLGIRHLRTRPYRPQTNGKACVSGSCCRPVGRRGCSLPSV